MAADDLGKAGIGLGVSIGLALGLPGQRSAAQNPVEYSLTSLERKAPHMKSVEMRQIDGG